MPEVSQNLNDFTCDILFQIISILTFSTHLILTVLNMPAVHANIIVSKLFTCNSSASTNETFDILTNADASKYYYYSMGAANEF
jgi:hypothetical protein